MRPQCEQACAPFRLALPTARLSGRAGERLGRGLGASLEFMDFRDYQPGDDVRHVDWRGYARTDQLRVRLYREEIAPVFDVIVDTSASMAVSERKATACQDLVDAVGHWAGQMGGRARRLAGGAGETEGALTFGGRDELLPTDPLRPRSVRIVLSDFLQPDDPGGAISRIAHGGALLWVVQLLDPWELEPAAEGARTLIDCESGSRVEIELDARTIAAYRQRLARLRSALRRATQSAGGRYVSVRAAEPSDMFRDGLLPQGLIEVAA